MQLALRGREGTGERGGRDTGGAHTDKTKNSHRSTVQKEKEEKKNCTSGNGSSIIQFRYAPANNYRDCSWPPALLPSEFTGTKSGSRHYHGGPQLTGPMVYIKTYQVYI